MKDNRRFTLEDKWIIGGEGTWKDLLVVSPMTKLTIDILGALFHPRKYYLFKKILFVTLFALYVMIAHPLQYISWGNYTPSRLLSLILGVLIGTAFVYTLTYVYRRAQLKWRDRSYSRKSSSEPWVPLDHSGDPRSAILLKRSVLIGGDSGSGKSNAVWQILEGLIKFGIPFRTTVLDPAGGVELQDLEHAAFTIGYVDKPSLTDQVITDFRDRMEDRLSKMKRLGYRQFDPTLPGLEDEPWHYLVIDELLLCAGMIKQGVLSPLGDVLAVGRKAGFLVIACTQLGQKSTLGDIRDLFPQRVCFGTKTMEMTDAVLGTAATTNGAVCHELKRVGSGYLWTEKARGYWKFHTKHIQNTLAIVGMGGEVDPRPPVNPRENRPQQTRMTKDVGNGHHSHNGMAGQVQARNPQSAATATLTHDASGQWALYKFHTSDGSLVFVGIAPDPNRAFRDHEQTDEWFELVDRSKTIVQWYPDYQQAVHSQQEIIRRDNPPWNFIK